MPDRFRCGGVITDRTTREELIARGFTPEAIEAAFRFLAKLKARPPRQQRPLEEPQ